MDPSGTTTGDERLAYTKLLGELGHHNSTPTDDHSQNDEMVRTKGRNSVEADEQQEAEEVGPDENTERVMLLYSLAPLNIVLFQSPRINVPCLLIRIKVSKIGCTQNQYEDGFKFLTFLL